MSGDYAAHLARENAELRQHLDYWTEVAADADAFHSRMVDAESKLAAIRNLADRFSESHYTPVDECGSFVRDLLDGSVNEGELEAFLFPHKSRGDR